MSGILTVFGVPVWVQITVPILAWGLCVIFIVLAVSKIIHNPSAGFWSNWDWASLLAGAIGWTLPFALSGPVLPHLTAVLLLVATVLLAAFSFFGRFDEPESDELVVSPYIR
jgi:hypothetical protein